MKIIHTVASVDDEAAGPSYSVPSLVAALARAGHDAEVAALGDGSCRTQLGARVVTLPRDKVWPQPLMRLGRSKAMRSYLLKGEADVFHAHGLWMMPCVYPAEAAKALNAPLVLAPRGMLGGDALAFSRTAKRAFWAAFQKQACERVNCFHATAESEMEDIRAFGLKQPVVVIPNGIDLPQLDEGDTKVADHHPYILSLGRVHPKKALDRLIAAFATVADEFPQWRLRIVGPSELGYADHLRSLALTLSLQNRVTIEDPVYQEEKIALMRNAEIFALSTLHENFGMTVAESLAVETPVISTKGAPWSGLDHNNCGWWIDHGEEPMVAALRTAMALSVQDRRAMGTAGRQWMNRDFGWANIASQMQYVYSWLMGRGERPDTVWLA
jgi:glycosyltransferase involved in cell wall biosynthesis